MLYRFVVKPLLFWMPAERVHFFTLEIFGGLLRLPLVGWAIRAAFRIADPRLHTTVFGLKFQNPVGLAAGFDKDGLHYPAMSALGFGFVEIGTVTPLPQSGNPQPRLFRLPADAALINRMGFNNGGVEAMCARLRHTQRPDNLIIGANIGKNKATPNDRAADDYLTCFDALFEYVDYFAVNVSSPNTPNLRELQEKEPLTRLLFSLQARNQARPQPKPILLKIAPDLTLPQLHDIVEIVQTTGIAGVIATNTTIRRSPLATDDNTVTQIGAGGLSGKPLRDQSTDIIRELHRLAPDLDIIAVGGIASAADALEKLEAGAKLVQIYTGLVYEGPNLVKRINKGLLATKK